MGGVSLCATQVADMLLELCVTELEDVATDSQSGRLSSQPVVVESSHPYTDDTSTSGTVKIPGTRDKPPGGDGGQSLGPINTEPTGLLFCVFARLSHLRCRRLEDRV